MNSTGLLVESGQVHFSCARIPVSLFFSEKDRTYLLACLLASMQPRTSLAKFKFKFPRARTYELIRARSRLYRSKQARKYVRSFSEKKDLLESSRRDLHNALLCTVLESTGENWGKKGLAKTTPKRKKMRKREAIKQRAASHLELRPLSNLPIFVKKY